MSTWTFIIEDDGAAFEDVPTAEIARILRRLADTFEGGMEDPVGSLQDCSGNSCGHVIFEDETGGVL